MNRNIRLAQRLKEINPSATLAITSKAKKLKSEGKDVISFAAGEPDFDTPDFVKDSAIEAIKSGFTKYTPSTGIPELKQAVCEKFKKDNGLDYAPSQIIVSCGAKHSIFNALFVLVDPLDEVIIPSPFWVSYPEMVRLCQGIPKLIATSPGNNFKITSADIKKNISPKTKVIILNSPSNPTGSVLGAEELAGIAEICVENNIYVISDEIYEKIIFDNLRHVSIASLNQKIHDITITVNGLSKSFSMTGWRIGYLGARQEIADAISNLQDHSTSNPTSISQKAALSALAASDEFSKKLCLEFQKRRDYIVKRVKNIPGLDCIVPQGAFYLFCDISRTRLDSLALAKQLLEEILVAVIPGEGFGRDDYIRLSFATGIPQIEKGLDRIEEWMKRHG